MSCINEITSGVTRDCSTINAPIGSGKDLYLINYGDIDIEATLDEANIGTDKNLTALIAASTTITSYTFEGTDYSVVASATGSLKEDGDMWYDHSIAFTVFNKTSEARQVIENLGKSRVTAVLVDRSTKLYEVFGLEHGLKVSAATRTYTGEQNSNFYAVTLVTPEISVVKESTLGRFVDTFTPTPSV